MASIKSYPQSLADEYQQRVDDAIHAPTLRQRYHRFGTILNEILKLLTADVPYALPGPYAQLTFVIANAAMRHSRPLRRLRLNCRYYDANSEAVAQTADADIYAMRVMLHLLRYGKAPDYDKREDTEETLERAKKQAKGWKAVRVTVVDAKDMSRALLANEKGTDNRRVDLSAYGYMSSWLRRGTTLILLYFGEELNHVVYEPDFLVDVTTVASCFGPTTDDPRLATINAISADSSSKHTLLGNLASQFLAEALVAARQRAAMPNDYKRSTRLFFRHNALALATTEGIDGAWHDKARVQQQNVNAAMVAIKEDHHFCPDDAATEVTLFGPSLGIQGRADLMQTDWNLVFEQKSGKVDFVTGLWKKDHYNQVNLYMLMMDACYGQFHNNLTSFFLFYSQYEPKIGLMSIGQSPSKELRPTLVEFRNRIAHDMLRYQDPREIEHDLMTWSADEFTNNPNTTLWRQYVKPRIVSVFDMIRNASDVARAYVFQFMAFLHREDAISRLGGSEHGRDGFASLWNSKAEERVEHGETLASLTFHHIERDEVDDPLYPPTVSDGSIVVMAYKHAAGAPTPFPNFRTGDPIILCDYPAEGEPDIRKTIDIRATLLDIKTHQEEDLIRIKMKVPMHVKYFKEKRRLWAIEHDIIAACGRRQIRQVMSLLGTSAARRDLILAQRRPGTRREGRRLEHETMNEMVERELGASDLFLLVGPPGTGKTSYGLMSILREELAREGHAVLLLSYTNRAVDEICGKLENGKLDYIRIGQRFSCADEYKPKLLSMREFGNVEELRRAIVGARIVVGTTSSISSSEGLFRLKRFDLAIVDEASQILEPSIIGILCSRTQLAGGVEVPSVGRFVLIGDEKQLPAVVQQRREQSAIGDPLLHGIGLDDARESFFARMMKLYGDDDALVYRLTRHGRMHEEVARFCNKHFYNNTLEVIPLAHQTGALNLGVRPGADALTRALATRRTLFIDSHSVGGDGRPRPTDNVNPHEADIIADVAYRVLTLRCKVDENTLGIVVPYRSQIMAIRSRLVTLVDDKAPELTGIAMDLTIDTVERLQGSERDVIIYGFTVSSLSQLQFLRDSQFTDCEGHVIDRKLNVALTRAREQLIVVGDTEILKSDPLYAALPAELGRL